MPSPMLGRRAPVEVLRVLDHRCGVAMRQSRGVRFDCFGSEALTEVRVRPAKSGVWPHQARSDGLSGLSARTFSRRSGPRFSRNSDAVSTSPGRGVSAQVWTSVSMS